MFGFTKFLLVKAGANLIKLFWYKLITLIGNILARFMPVLTQMTPIFAYICVIIDVN